MSKEISKNVKDFLGKNQFAHDWVRQRSGLTQEEYTHVILGKEHTKDLSEKIAYGLRLPHSFFYDEFYRMPEKVPFVPKPVSEQESISFEIEELAGSLENLRTLVTSDRTEFSAKELAAFRQHVKQLEEEAETLISLIKKREFDRL